MKEGQFDETSLQSIEHFSGKCMVDQTLVLEYMREAKRKFGWSNFSDLWNWKGGLKILLHKDDKT